MSLSSPLCRLIESAAPLFAGEAEVVRTYWDSPVRTVETDLRWLELQVFKEFKGSGVGDYDNRGVIMGPLTEVLEVLPKMDIEVPRHRIRDLLEGLYEEFTHLVAFADVYDAIRPEGTPRLDPHRCQGWEEDNVLTQLRYSTLAEHGEIGARASRFSEGGYCTLFREGMRIADRGGNDALIADACAKVYDDEFEHMLGGIVGLDSEGMTEAEWDRMGALVRELLKARVAMRNGQFSNPLSPERMAEIHAGKIDPVEFDYDKAEALMAA